MTSISLPTLAWASLVLGVVTQGLWLLTDGRRGNRPDEIFNCMGNAVAAVVFGPIIVALAFYAPDDLWDFLALALMCCVIASHQRTSWQRSTPPHPMTAAWQSAIRRSHIRSRLCVVAAGAVAALTISGDTFLCALGTIAAANLCYLEPPEKDKGLYEVIYSPRTIQALPFYVPFAVYILILVEAPLFSPGEALVYADLSLTILAPIPGNDANTVSLLHSYIGLLLAVLLVSLLADLATDALGGNDAVRLLTAFLMRIGRAIAMGCLLFLVEQEDPLTASAELVSWVLILMEFLVLYSPDPKPLLALGGLSKAAADAPSAGPSINATFGNSDGNG